MSLLRRACYVQKLSSGIYSYLPLGYRTLQKISDIIRKELCKAGFQELMMPVLQPVHLWQESGRYSQFGTDALPALVVKSRGGEFVLGPTHEEVVTHLVSQVVESWRQLPQMVFQIQTKFRDEARPRFGLMRTRELLMCDGYSFDTDEAELLETYKKVTDAYMRIMDRLELEVYAVEASSGAIGGDVNHEFMVPCKIGEDYFCYCNNCSYRANIEVARFSISSESTDAQLELVETPIDGSYESVAKFFTERGHKLASKQVLLSILLKDKLTSGFELWLIPGGRKFELPNHLELASDSDLRALGLPTGFLGPIGINSKKIKIVADEVLRENPKLPWIIGSNQDSSHYINAMLNRDFSVDEFKKISNVVEGDFCVRCNNQLELVRSVEVAHTFMLKEKYSAKMTGATYLNSNGFLSPFCMGCYGIGVSRLLGVLAEMSPYENQLAWNKEVSPFDLHLVSLVKEATSVEYVENLYTGLVDADINVLYDDRKETAGVKLNDADLLGMPYLLIVGEKGLKNGNVELKNKLSGKTTLIDSAMAMQQISQHLSL